MVAIGISGYFGFLLEDIGITLPNWMLGAPGTGDGHVVDLFAMILCLLIAYLLTRGIRAAARFETAVVGLKIALVLLVVVVGFFHVTSSNATGSRTGRGRSAARACRWCRSSGSGSRSG